MTNGSIRMFIFMNNFLSIKRAYLAISLSNRPKLEEELGHIQSILKRKGIEVFIFVDHYHFSKEQEKEMMQTAFREIDRSDLLIAELSKKAIGVGVEVGYAYAKGIPVLYLRQELSEPSTTVAGSSTYQIVYQNPKDLKQQLDGLFRS